MSAPGTALLAAGGTGGHLFPAQALAEVLNRRGWRVHLVTDARAREYSGVFPAEAMHVVASATPSGRSPVKIASAMLSLSRGLFASWRLIGRIKPDVAIGFGGYPTVPPMVAARLRGIPIILQEQNAVMGRANKALASSATAIATGFPKLEGVARKDRSKLVHTGNPVRRLVGVAAGRHYSNPTALGRFKLLVFGGSQGARVFSDIVPEGVAALPKELRERLSIVQQAREEDVARVTEAYEKAGVSAEIATFFKDLPGRMADAHLIIARSGASTVSEIAVIGRPAILVPLPHSIDNDQTMNARVLSSAGGATILPQGEFTPERLADELQSAIQEPARLTEAAAASRTAGRSDAAQQLADLVEQTAWSNTGEPSS